MVQCLSTEYVGICMHWSLWPRDFKLWKAEARLTETVAYIHWLEVEFLSETHHFGNSIS